MVENRNKPARPSRRRLSLQAIRVLEEAYAAGENTPIALTPAIRLALGWLIYDNIAEVWQAEVLVKALTNPPNMSIGESAGPYCRQRDIYTAIAAWEREINVRDMIEAGTLRPHHARRKRG